MPKTRAWLPAALTHALPVSKAGYEPAPKSFFEFQEQFRVKSKRERSGAKPPNSNTLPGDFGPVTHFSMLSFLVYKIGRTVSNGTHENYYYYYCCHNG